MAYPLGVSRACVRANRAEGKNWPERGVPPPLYSVNLLSLDVHQGSGVRSEFQSAAPKFGGW